MSSLTGGERERSECRRGSAARAAVVLLRCDRPTPGVCAGLCSRPFRAGVWLLKRSRLQRVRRVLLRREGRGALRGGACAVGSAEEASVCRRP